MDETWLLFSYFPGVGEGALQVAMMYDAAPNRNISVSKFCEPTRIRFAKFWVGKSLTNHHLYARFVILKFVVTIDTLFVILKFVVTIDTLFVILKFVVTIYTLFVILKFVVIRE